VRNAKYYAQAAAILSNIANDCKPEENSPYKDREELAVYHIRCAAALTRTIADHKATQEAKE
jgi:hypothetical protein